MATAKAPTSQRSRRIQLQRDTGSSQDAMGEPIEQWQTTNTVWTISVTSDTNKAREFAANGQVKAESVTQFKIRYIRNISAATHRVMYNGRIFDINAAINENEQDTYLILICKEATG